MLGRDIDTTGMYCYEKNNFARNSNIIIDVFIYIL